MELLYHPEVNNILTKLPYTLSQKRLETYLIFTVNFHIESFKGQKGIETENEIKTCILSL